MDNKSKLTVYEIISIAGFLMMACSFLFMPFVDNSNGVNTYSVIIGLMFWMGLLIGMLMQIIAACTCKEKNKRHRIGLCSFMKNMYGIIADIVLVISIVMFIIAMIVTHQTGYMCFIAIALFTFSFSMHCVCNGKVFRYILSR